MQRLMAWMGWGLLGAIMVVNIARYGKRWAFAGPYYLPKTLVDATGTRFLDGSEFDLMTAAVLRSGLEDEITALCLAVLLLLFVYLFRFMRQALRLERELDLRAAQLRMQAIRQQLGDDPSC